MGNWKPEYGKTRKTKTYTSTEVKKRWNDKHYDSISLRLPKGSKELIKAKANEQGLSINAFIIGIIANHDPALLTVDFGGGGYKDPR